MACLVGILPFSGGTLTNRARYVERQSRRTLRFLVKVLQLWLSEEKARQLVDVRSFNPARNVQLVALCPELARPYPPKLLRYDFDTCGV